MTDHLSLCVQDIQDILEEDCISLEDFDQEDIVNHVKAQLKYSPQIIRNAVATLKAKFNGSRSIVQPS